MKRIFWLLALLLLLCPCVQAASVTISWTPNSESDLHGYKVYYGPQSRIYNEVINVGMPGWNSEGREEYIVNVAPTGTYYFTVSAYDESGNESDFGNESSVTYSDEPLPPQEDLLPPIITKVDIAANGLSFIITWKSQSTDVERFRVHFSSIPDRFTRTKFAVDPKLSGQDYEKTINSEQMIEGHTYYFAMTAWRGTEASSFSDVVEKVFGATEPPPVLGRYIIWMPEQVMMEGDSGEVILKFKKVEQ